MLFTKALIGVAFAVTIVAAQDFEFHEDPTPTERAAATRVIGRPAATHTIKVGPVSRVCYSNMRCQANGMLEWT